MFESGHRFEKILEPSPGLAVYADELPEVWGPVIMWNFDLKTEPFTNLDRTVAYAYLMLEEANYQLDELADA